MRKSILLLSSFAALVVAGHVFAESRLPRGLVGFTTATTTGDVGVLAMTKLCQADFPASRICTSEEVIATQTVPNLPSGVRAWVMPTPKPASVQSQANASFAVFLLDASGVLADPTRCAAPLTIDSEGRFTPDCGSDPRRVACCAGQPELLGDIDGNGKHDLADSALLRRFLAGEVSALPG